MDLFSFTTEPAACADGALNFGSSDEGWTSFRLPTQSHYARLVNTLAFAALGLAGREAAPRYVLESGGQRKPHSIN